MSFKKILQSGCGNGSLATVARVSGTEFRQAVEQMHATGTNLRYLNFWNCTFSLPLGRIKGKYRRDHEVEDLGLMYMYQQSAIDVVPQYYEEFYEVLVCGELFGSMKGRNNRSSVILARWHGQLGLDTETVETRPGKAKVINCQFSRSSRTYTFE